MSEYYICYVRVLTSIISEYLRLLKYLLYFLNKQENFIHYVASSCILYSEIIDLIRRRNKGGRYLIHIYYFRELMERQKCFIYTADCRTCQLRRQLRYTVQ
uniref:Uncharacterized protein n=1 Tax=Cacopsylla melanoneura TaxID=428564 RepID=A0A8D8PPU5_9HEMI